MKILYLLVIGILIITVLPLVKPNIEGYKNEEEEEKEKYELTIDLIDEFKRLRFLLDKYDNEAIKYPGDTDLAKRRTSLEHMLTKIVVYIQKKGHKISVSDMKTFLS